MIYNNSNEILNTIRKIMKEEKITINELSNKLQRSQPATSQLFRQKNISFDVLKEIAEAIDYDLEINFIKKTT